MSRPAPPLALWKKVLFGVVTTALFFAALEGAARIVGVAALPPLADPYVGFSSRLPLFVADPEAPEQLVTAQERLSFFHAQRFPRAKPRGTLRVFALGGSTTYGRPYDDDSVSFPAWLRSFLPLADAGRDYEVINAGGISYASYRVALIMEELVSYAPDLFIVYTGHNEFLERRSYPRAVETPRVLNEVGALASQTRLYAGAHRLLQRLRPAPQRQAAGSVLDGEVRAMLDRSTGPADYQRDDAWAEQVVAHYRFNLHRIAELAERAGAHLLFVTPASNLGSCSPFKSQWMLPTAERAAARAAMQRARALGADGEWAEALAIVDGLLERDPRHGHALYLRGRALAALGRSALARSAFGSARDEDICPLRATTRMIEIVREVAAKRGVPVVDFAAQSDALAPQGIPGEEAFLDHVHLDAAGYGRLARAIVDEMVAQHWIDASADWNDASIEEISRTRLAGIDRAAQAAAMRNLAKVYSWAGKWRDAERAAKRAIELAPEDAPAHLVLGTLASMRGDHESAVAALRRASELQPGIPATHHQLGVALYALGRRDEALVQFRSATRADPNFAHGHLYQGHVLLADERPDAALAAYEAAVRADPRWAAGYLGAAQALHRLGRASDALHALQRAVPHASAPERAAIADELDAQGHPERADEVRASR